MGKNIGWLGVAAIGLSLVSTVLSDRNKKKEMNEAIDRAVDQKLKALTDGNGKQAD